VSQEVARLLWEYKVLSSNPSPTEEGGEGRGGESEGGEEGQGGGEEEGGGWAQVAHTATQEAEIRRIRFKSSTGK
jgi:hypothetical protein